jgi:hypothetical protein
MAHRHVYPTVSIASKFVLLLAGLGRDEASESVRSDGLEMKVGTSMWQLYLSIGRTDWTM